jgi:hypothetical protein
MTPVDLNERIKKIANKDSGVDKGNDTMGYWRVSFEEGIDPSHINDSKLPKSEDKSDEFFDLKLVGTVWSYDFEFTTPSCMSIYLINHALCI